MGANASRPGPGGSAPLEREFAFARDPADAARAAPRERDAQEILLDAHASKIRRLKREIKTGLLAPFYQPTDTDEDEECPICCHTYPEFNYYKCCSKPVCTACYVELLEHRRLAACPFCNHIHARVRFRVMPEEEKLQRRVEEAEVHAAEMRARRRGDGHLTPGSSTPGTMTAADHEAESIRGPATAAAQPGCTLDDVPAAHVRRASQRHAGHGRRGSLFGDADSAQTDASFLSGFGHAGGHWPSSAGTPGAAAGPATRLPSPTLLQGVRRVPTPVPAAVAPGYALPAPGVVAGLARMSAPALGGAAQERPRQGLVEPAAVEMERGPWISETFESSGINSLSETHLWRSGSLQAPGLGPSMPMSSDGSARRRPSNGLPPVHPTSAANTPLDTDCVFQLAQGMHPSPFACTPPVPIHLRCGLPPGAGNGVVCGLSAPSGLPAAMVWPPPAACQVPFHLQATASAESETPTGRPVGLAPAQPRPHNAEGRPPFIHDVDRSHTSAAGPAGDAVPARHLDGSVGDPWRSGAQQGGDGARAALAWPPTTPAHGQAAALFHTFPPPPLAWGPFPALSPQLGHCMAAASVPGHCMYAPCDHSTSAAAVPAGCVPWYPPGRDEARGVGERPVWLPMGHAHYDNPASRLGASPVDAWRTPDGRAAASGETSWRTQLEPSTLEEEAAMLERALQESCVPAAASGRWGGGAGAAATLIPGSTSAASQAAQPGTQGLGESPFATAGHALLRCEARGAAEVGVGVGTRASQGQLGCAQQQAGHPHAASRPAGRAAAPPARGLQQGEHAQAQEPWWKHPDDVWPGFTGHRAGVDCDRVSTAPAACDPCTSELLAEFAYWSRARTLGRSRAAAALARMADMRPAWPEASTRPAEDLGQAPGAQAGSRRNWMAVRESAPMWERKNRDVLRSRQGLPGRSRPAPASAWGSAWTAFQQQVGATAEDGVAGAEQAGERTPTSSAACPSAACEVPGERSSGEPVGNEATAAPGEETAPAGTEHLSQEPSETGPGHEHIAVQLFMAPLSPLSALEGPVKVLLTVKPAARNRRQPTQNGASHTGDHSSSCTPGRDEAAQQQPHSRASTPPGSSGGRAGHVRWALRRRPRKHEHTITRAHSLRVKVKPLQLPARPFTSLRAAELLGQCTSPAPPSPRRCRPYPAAIPALRGAAESSGADSGVAAGGTFAPSQPDLMEAGTQAAGGDPRQTPSPRLRRRQRHAARTGSAHKRLGTVPAPCSARRRAASVLRSCPGEEGTSVRGCSSGREDPPRGSWAGDGESVDGGLPRAPVAACQRGLRQPQAKHRWRLDVRQGIDGGGGVPVGEALEDTPAWQGPPHQSGSEDIARRTPSFDLSNPQTVHLPAADTAVLAEEASGGPGDAVTGVVVVQPDGSPCIGWLEAHSAVEHLTDARKRALVMLSVTHARDLELPTGDHMDEDRVLEPIVAGDGAAARPRSQNHTVASLSPGARPDTTAGPLGDSVEGPYAAGPCRSGGTEGTDTPASSTCTHSVDVHFDCLPEWLTRMRQRDEEAQRLGHHPI